MLILGRSQVMVIVVVVFACYSIGPWVPCVCAVHAHLRPLLSWIHQLA